MRKLLPIAFDRKLFILLFAGFIVATMVGTLSHECGHYLLARYYGFRHATIGYAYTDYREADTPFRPQDSAIRTIYLTYIANVDSGRHSALKLKYESLLKEYHREHAIMCAAGPMETILTGSLGLLLIVASKKRFRQTDRLNFRQWVCVFLALFWLREVFNFLGAACMRLVYKRAEFHSDESLLSKQMGMGQWGLPVIAAAAAFTICSYVIFTFVPPRQRLTLIISGFAGGLTGAWLWLIAVGPKLMPLP